MPPTVDPMTEEMAQDQAQIMGKTDTDLGVDADRIAAAPAAGERDTDTVVNQAAASQAAQPLSNETAPEEGSASKPAATAQSGQNQSAPGFFGRLMGRVQSAGVLKRKLDDEMLEQLEELLITSDMGVDTALRVNLSRSSRDKTSQSSPSNRIVGMVLAIYWICPLVKNRYHQPGIYHPLLAPSAEILVTTSRHSGLSTVAAHFVISEPRVTAS